MAIKIGKEEEAIHWIERALEAPWGQKSDSLHSSYGLLLES